MFHPHDLNELMLFKPFMNQMWCLVLSRKCRLKRCGGICLHTVLINWDFLERWLIIHFFGRQFVQQWIVAHFFTVTIEIYCYQTLLVSQKNQFPATFSSTFHSKESLLPLPWGNPPFASLNQGWGDALILSECTRGFLERMHTLVLYTKALYLAQSRGQQQQNKLSLCRTRRIKCETEGKLIRCSSAAHERTLQPGESLTFEQRTHFGESMHGT